MAETRDDLLMTRHSSARRYLGLYFLLAVFALAAWSDVYVQRIAAPPRILIPAGALAVIVMLVHGALVGASTRYRIFRASLELRRGILSRHIDSLQLFRVRDLSLSQGLLSRLLGIGDVIVQSTDVSTPHLVLRGVRDPMSVYDLLRKLVASSQATRQTMIVESEHP